VSSEEYNIVVSVDRGVEIVEFVSDTVVVVTTILDCMNSVDIVVEVVLGMVM
jgi:hypothetical protein